MTEAEWLTAADPLPMLEFVRHRAPERKLRLFGCACCRRVFPYVDHDGSRALTDLVERFADGELSADRLRDAARAHERRCHAGLPDWEIPRAADRAALQTAELFEITSLDWVVSSAVDAAVRDLSWPTRAQLHLLRDEAVRKITLPHGPGYVDEYLRAVQPLDGRQEEVEAGFRSQELGALADCLRCLLGPSPFRRAALDPDWQSSTVVALARGIYHDRAFDRMPILADALQDAGCDSDDVLNHCRGDGPHVRGCWVVDLVLNKQ